MTRCDWTRSAFYFGTCSQIAHCCQQEFIAEIDWDELAAYGNLDAWYSVQAELAGVRASLDSNQQHPACISCWQYELQGMSSKRTRGLAEHDLEGGQGIEYVDLRLGTRCNLQCKMCDGWASDQLANLGLELHRQGKPNDLFRTVPHPSLIPTPSNIAFLLDLVVRLPHLKGVTLAGGEPMIMPEVDEFCQKLIDMGKTDVVITIITNCTSARTSLVNKLKNFRRVEIAASIDATGPRLEFQRSPARWTTVSRSFDRFLEAGFECNITPTLTMLTLEDLPNLFEFARAREVPVMFNELYEPSYLKYQFVPSAAREPVQEYFTTLELPSTNHGRNWQQFARDGLHTYLEPTQMDCDRLRHNVDVVWNPRGKYKFLDLYPWASYMIERANDYTPY
jgi:molybdenum cofactor biosynthesis enzyme MoaA